MNLSRSYGEKVGKVRNEFAHGKRPGTTLVEVLRARELPVLHGVGAPAVGSSLTYVAAPFLLAVRKLAHRHSYQNMESSMSSNMSSEVHRRPRRVRRKRASYLRLNCNGAQVLRETCALVPM